MGTDAPVFPRMPFGLSLYFQSSYVVCLLDIFPDDMTGTIGLLNQKRFGNKLPVMILKTSILLKGRRTEEFADDPN
jgi:hypothetical protein